MAFRSYLCVVSAGLSLSLTSVAQAQVELGAALRDLSTSGVQRLPRAFIGQGNRRLAVVAEYAAGSGVSELLVDGRYRPLWLTPSEVPTFLRDNPTVKLHWSPPRYPLLDEADDWVGGSTFRHDTGRDGTGVIIGIVDTGIDVSHRDLRDADGKSRVRYLLDFSRPPSDRQPELEAEYGCSDENECAIYDNSDIDRILDNAITGDEPKDTYGHGTHVASLAAGNGLSSETPRYIGVAPGASIIGARVSRAADGVIFDADIIQATRFIFEQAERLGMPAVVNLSLGSDFGAHDGSSPLERALASFVGPQFPGRALVVAAGNSGGLYSAANTGEPEPLGIHTEVHVPRESPVRVPLITPRSSSSGLSGGTFYVWLGFRPGDEVSVGVEVDGSTWIPDVSPGRATTYELGEIEGTVFNGPSGSDRGIDVPESNAVLVVDGPFEPGAVFTLRLSGHGSAQLWVQSSGGVSPEFSEGVLVPRGEKQGTINVPASHPDLIAVGATVNRNRWRDTKGSFLVGAEDGSEGLLAVDGTAAFSAAGPNAGGAMKPDLVAPGMHVIGALSTHADPRTNGGNGLFASQGRCGMPDYECFVIDDERHAVTSGTSMSAPLVAGAAALLLQARPELTQAQVRALLQAGARQPSGTILAEQQLGPGVLDLQGTLAALIAEDSPIHRLPGAASRIALARSFIHPDPTQPLLGLLELRDDEDLLADGFDERRLQLSVSGGDLQRPPVRQAPGLYQFQVTAREGSGGQTLVLRLSFDGRVLAERRLSIGVDRWVAEGEPLAHGGCAVVAPARNAGSWLVALALATAVARRRRRFVAYIATR